MITRFTGRPASSGIALGSAYLLHPESRPARPEFVAPAQIERELARLDRARRTSRAELRALRDQVRRALGERYAGLLDAQLLILDDPLLLERARARIRTERSAAAWALEQVVGELLEQFDSVTDEYLRERGGELDDVHRRLQRALRGEPAGVASPPDGPLVVVAHAVGPSDTVLLARRTIVGLATDVGGVTSHSSILAQALSIPAVVGLGDLSSRVSSGDPLLLDGTRGEVVLRPDATLVADAERRRDELRRIEVSALSLTDRPPMTSDGTGITVRANIEFPAEVERARHVGTAGIGLYRSEYLFLGKAPEIPDEWDHANVYAELAGASSPHPVVVRALDLGGDKLQPDARRDASDNPALGLRGVRLCLARPDLFRPQLRGLLRAAAMHPSLHLLIPMVTVVSELRRVREMLREEARSLREAGIDAPDGLPLGAMIEVPAAALAADEIATEADFFSLGTNDLLQYLLAADRGNEALASIFDLRHRGVLRLIDDVVRAAAAAGIPLGICGELAADPAAIPLLLGLGLRELSVQPRSAPAVRDAIRLVDLQDARNEVLEHLGRPAAARREAPAAADD